MLGQRRRRWANIKTLLFQRVFSGTKGNTYTMGLVKNRRPLPVCQFRDPPLLCIGDYRFAIRYGGGDTYSVIRYLVLFLTVIRYCWGL